MFAKKNIKNIYALTPMQEGILFQSLYDPESLSYFEQFNFHISGELNIPVFEETWNELMNRHDILRTIFVYKNVPQPLQIVLKKRKIDFVFEDISVLSTEEQDDHCQKYQDKDKLNPFDLSKDVLIRLAVFKLNDTSFNSTWTLHHILLDGWSCGILYEEMMRIYSSLIQGKKTKLPPAVPFSSYIRWLKKQDSKAAKDYWKNYLIDYQKLTTIPRITEKQRQDFIDKNDAFDLNESITLALEETASKNHVTMNTVLQTVWAILLNKYNAIDDIIFGATVSGRPAEINGIEQMVGLFINAIPVRIKMDGKQRFNELLKKVHNEAAESSNYHYYSLADILNQTDLKQDLFDHVLVFENYPDPEILGKDQNNPFVIDSFDVFDHTHFDLTIIIAPEKNKIKFSLTYNQTVYDPLIIDNIASHLKTITQAVIKDNEINIDSIEILSQDEKHFYLQKRDQRNDALIKQTRNQNRNIFTKYVPPQNKQQEKLVSIWKEVLKITSPGIDDNFFESGGHSLTAMQIISRIHKEFHVEISISTFSENPNIRSLSNVITQQEISKLNEIEILPQKPYYDVSHSQKRLWILDKTEEHFTAYNLSMGFIFKGNLDSKAFKHALRITVNRHESLRTTFVEINGGPVQKIHKTGNFEFIETDLKTEKDNQIIAENIAKKESIRPFDLTNGPLLRIRLLWLSDESCVILLNIHHIICDGWSLGLFENEILCTYQSIVDKRTMALPPLKIQYKDYAAWQNKALSDKNVRKHQDYWFKKLSGEDLPVLNLPTDFTRPAIQTYNGNTLSYEIDSGITSDLNQFCRDNEVSVFIALLSSLKVLLYHHTGQEDIIIGAPIAGRNHRDLEDQIGFYVNTLALRDKVDGNEPFKSLLDSVKQTTLDAYEHQVYPFDLLVKKLNITRDVSNSPVFNVMMALQNKTTQEIELNNLEILPFDYETGISQFDLTFNFSEDKETLCFDIIYNTDLFEKTTIVRMASHFIVLLRSILNNSNQRINHFNILTESEKKCLLIDFNNTIKDYPSDKTIVDLFEEQVEKTPHKPALIYENTKFTYEELNQAANLLAHHLIHTYQIQKDDLVGVVADRSEKMIISLLGILKAGAAYLPVDPEYPEQRIDYIKQDSKCKVILSEKDFKFETNKTVNPKQNISVDQLAYVIYTSGSTGKPKGVMIEHGGFVNMCLAQIAGFGISESDHVLQFASPSFDASLSEIFMALLKGAALVLISKEIINDPKDFVKFLDKNQVSVITFPPVYLNMLNKHPLPTVKTIITAGEPAIISDVNFYCKNKTYFNAYGPTESSVCATYYKVNKDVTFQDVIPIGKAIHNLSVFILNEFLNPVPVGIPGEICISGIGLARGYLNNQELTEEKFVRSPFYPDALLYKTGDSGKWMPDGNILFLGRKDDQVKIRGHRIEIGEIENRLRQHPLIKDVLIIAKESDPNIKELAAYFISHDNISTLELKTFLNEQLPEFMIPSHLIQLEQFPLTVHGKIDKKQLPEPIQSSDITSNQDYAPPENEIQELFVKVWQKLLNKDTIGIFDNFFDMGGDSIRAIQFISHLHQKNITLKVRDIFQYPTIAQLSEKMEKSVLINQKTVTGIVPLTAITRWFFKEFSFDKHHFNHSELFYSNEGFNEEALRAVFLKLQAHHDALRMTYKLIDDKVIQKIQDLNHPCDFQTIDLRDSIRAKENLEFQMERLQASLNLESGPLMKVALFKCNDGDRLLVILHHLIVDGISWRILLEDIILGYKQYLSTKSIALPLKTHSFKAWAENIQKYSISESLLEEIDYWKRIESTPVGMLPSDNKIEDLDNIHLMKDTSSCGLTLSVSETNLLLTKATQTYQTNVHEMLLAVLAYSMKKWHGHQKTLITLEGHGRQDIIKNMDISRTVGWFTSTYPVILESPDTKDTYAQIETIKQILKNIPCQGMGYSILKYINPEKYIQLNVKPCVSFNYLGQFNDNSREIFHIDENSPGHSISKNAKIIHDIDINAVIEKQKLQLYVIFDNKRYQMATMENFIMNYEDHLQHIIFSVHDRSSSSVYPWV